MVNSQLPGFYKLSIDERRNRVAEQSGLDRNKLDVLSGEQGLTDDQANRMVENALGVIGMPLGLCVNMQINGKDWMIPMAVEEPSVVAAASHAAKLLRAGGGVSADLTDPHMVGQIQILDVPDLRAAEQAVLAKKDEMLAAANKLHPTMVKMGGGAFDMEIRHLAPISPDDPVGAMMVVHLLVDVQDAMGANAINNMCEHLAGPMEELTGGRVRLRILSNLSDRRLVRVRGRVPIQAFSKNNGVDPMDVVKGIEEASVFAERDPYRAATHNKGIMNGVDAVLVAFGQDWRAVEAGAHAYAARNGRYTAMATWRVRGEYLHGDMQIPMAVGTVGGVLNVHPTVGVTRKLARIERAADLAAATAAVGLAQNLGALRALASEGIQQGHMRLHARNVAVAAGAQGDEIDHVARDIAERRSVRVGSASEALATLRAS